MLKTTFLSLSSLFILSGCANMNTSIENLNKSLYSAENTVSGVYEQNISSVITKLPSKTAYNNMNEAYDTIQKTLSILACGTKTNEEYTISRVRRYTSDRNYNYSIKVPQRYMKYHTDGCLTIDRIDGYKDYDLNNFRFNVVYLSNQTGETFQRQYEMTREQQGGIWLFKF